MGCWWHTRDDQAHDPCVFIDDCFVGSITGQGCSCTCFVQLELIIAADGFEFGHVIGIVAGVVGRDGAFLFNRIAYFIDVCRFLLIIDDGHDALHLLYEMKRVQGHAEQ